MATPPINVVGQFVVSKPFEVEPGAIYKCEAIRGFDALEMEGVDIYATFYRPHDIDKERFDEDRLNGTDIVTLMSVSSDPINIPSSFIESFPNVEAIPYKHNMLVFDLGILPDGFELSATIDQCKQLLDNNIGIDTKVRNVTHPVTDVIDLPSMSASPTQGLPIKT
jgi:hypothetical protein